MSFRQSTLFILRLSARPFSGLVVRRLLILWLYLICTSRLASELWWCLFLQGVFQHFGYLLSLDSQPLSNMDSLKGSDIGGSIDLFYSSEILVFCRPNLWGLIVVRSSGGFFGIFLYLFFLFSSGNLQIYRKYCLATASDVPGSLVPAFCYVRLVTKKLSGDFSLALRRAYSYGHISSFSVRK